MNYKKIWLSFVLGLACLSCQDITASTVNHRSGAFSKSKEASTKVKKTEVQTAPPCVYWTDGNGRVTYSVNANTSTVVKKALEIFESDMKAVTGLAAKQKAGAPLQIYQLDMLTNKEFSALEKSGVPIHKIITAHDAYYIGVKNNKLMVVGSDARGTAYAIMYLSQKAGVSPWAAWNGVKPQPRRTLSTPSDQTWIMKPRIEFRGFALNGSQWMKLQNYSEIARLMLRLRCNTLWQVDGKHNAAYDKAVVDSFDLCVAENYKVTEVLGKKHKKHKRNIDNVKMVFDDEQIQLHCVAPGLLREALDNKNFHESKSSHHDKSHASDASSGKHSSASSNGKHYANVEDDAWIANVTNPKLSMLQLSMMTELAWNENALKIGSKRYLQKWLSEQFGNVLGKRIQPLMEEYYRLTSIRQPAYMAMPYGDTEFHSGEFGNELERYLYAYDQLKSKVEALESKLSDDQKDGFFEVVKYPIFSAALIAEKELEAQEARHIARPGLFDKDSEAKAAAAVSLTAYNQLKQLNAQYTTIASRHRQPSLVVYGAEMQSPTLPGTLSASDIQKYRKEAFNRTEDLKPLNNYKSDVIAKNACDWTTTTPAHNTDGKKSSSTSSASATAETIRFLPLLGHSNQAVKLPKGASLNYTFYTSQSGDARFTLAAIPNYMSGVKNMRVSVSIDHAEPVELEINEAYNGKQWKLDLWRGQTLRNFYVTLPSGNHSIEIQALDDHVILDQWILDYDVDREYYVIPVGK
jgi:hypothetical protein